MGWGDILKNIGISSAVAVGIITLIAYLIRIVFKSLVDKDVENFKAQLQLSISEHQIMFASLHAERAKVIKELYSKLAVTEKKMRSFLLDHSVGLDSPKREQALKSLDEFKDYVSQNEVYFDETISQLLNGFTSSLKCMDTEKFLAEDFKSVANQTGSLEDAEEANKMKKEIWDRLNKSTIPELKRSLKQNFQKILGIGRYEEVT